MGRKKGKKKKRKIGQVQWHTPRIPGTLEDQGGQNARVQDQPQQYDEILSLQKKYKN